MLCFNSNDITKSVGFNELTDSMEEALISIEKEECFVPERAHEHYGDNTLLLMPAFTKDYFATKLVSVNPENFEKGIPTIFGLVTLNDGETGEPVAIFNGAQLTAMRTGAVGALGVRHFSSPDAKTLGIIGLGKQGFYQALFACSQRNIEKLYVWDAFSNKIDEFKNDFLQYYPNIEVITAYSGDEILKESEIIILATNSEKPVIPNSIDLLKGKLFIGIGSYRPNMREFPQAMFNHLQQVVVDTKTAITESGDIALPIQEGLIEKNQIITFGEYLLDKDLLKKQSSIFYKSVGMAAFDLMTAALIYKKSKENNIGTEIDI